MNVKPFNVLLVDIVFDYINDIRRLLYLLITFNTTLSEHQMLQILFETEKNNYTVEFCNLQLER